MAETGGFEVGANEVLSLSLLSLAFIFMPQTAATPTLISLAPAEC